MNFHLCHIFFHIENIIRDYGIHTLALSRAILLLANIFISDDDDNTIKRHIKLNKREF